MRYWSKVPLHEQFVMLLQHLRAETLAQLGAKPDPQARNVVEHELVVHV